MHSFENDLFDNRKFLLFDMALLTRCCCLSLRTGTLLIGIIELVRCRIFIYVNYPVCTFAEGASIYSFLIQVLTLMAGVYCTYVLVVNRTDFSEPKGLCIDFRVSL